MSISHILANSSDGLFNLAANNVGIVPQKFLNISALGSTVTLTPNQMCSTIFTTGAAATVNLPGATGLMAYLSATGMTRFDQAVSASGSSFSFQFLNAGAGTQTVSNNSDTNWSLLSSMTSGPLTFPYLLTTGSSKTFRVMKSGAATLQLQVF